MGRGQQWAQLLPRRTIEVCGSHVEEIPGCGPLECLKRNIIRVHACTQCVSRCTGAHPARKTIVVSAPAQPSHPGGGPPAFGREAFSGQPADAGETAWWKASRYLRSPGARMAGSRTRVSSKACWWGVSRHQGRRGGGSRRAGRPPGGSRSRASVRSRPGGRGRPRLRCPAAPQPPMAWLTPRRPCEGVAWDEEDVRTRPGRPDPRAGQSHGPGPGPGGEVSVDGVAQQLGDGTGRECHRPVLGDRHEMGQGDSDRRFPATAPRPVEFDGRDAMLSAFQIVPVRRRTGRASRGAAYDRVGLKPHRLPHSAVVQAGGHGPLAPLARQVGTGPAIHTPAVAFALVEDQGHGPGVSGGDDDLVSCAEGDGIHGSEHALPSSRFRSDLFPRPAGQSVGPGVDGIRRGLHQRRVKFLPTPVVGVDGEGDPGHRRRQLRAAPGTHEHVQTSSPSPRIPRGLWLARRGESTGFGATRRGFLRITSPPSSSGERRDPRGTA